MRLTPRRTARTKTRPFWRFGNWLRAVIQKERLADPQWDDDERRERTGKMGENIRGQETNGSMKR